MINAAPISEFRDEDGRVSQWQIAEGNGHYYLFDMTIGEAVQELPGVRVMSDKQLPDHRGKEHTENKIAISFDVQQVAAALEDAGFEVSEGNVTDIVDYINNGGESVENFGAAFRTLIADAGTDLRIRKSASASANAIQGKEEANP